MSERDLGAEGAIGCKTNSAPTVGAGCKIPIRVCTCTLLGRIPQNLCTREFCTQPWGIHAAALITRLSDGQHLVSSKHDCEPSNR